MYSLKNHYYGIKPGVWLQLTVGVMADCGHAPGFFKLLS